MMKRTIVGANLTMKTSLIIGLQHIRHAHTWSDELRGEEEDDDDDDDDEQGEEEGKKQEERRESLID